MIKNIFILACILVLGYSYLTNTSIKTMFNHAQKEEVDRGVKWQNPIKVEKL